MNLFPILALAIVTGVNCGKVAQSSYSVVHDGQHLGTTLNSNPFYSFKSNSFGYGGHGGGFGRGSWHGGSKLGGASFFGNKPHFSGLHGGGSSGRGFHHGSAFGGFGGGGYGGGGYGRFNGALKPRMKTCGVAPTHCEKSPFRTFSGACNHLTNAGLGMAGGVYSRLLSAKYGDGVQSPTTSVTGAPLPNARLVSLNVFGEQDVEDPKYTIYNMQWGQIMTHDMSLQFDGQQSTRHPTRCCTDNHQHMPQGSSHATCFPIEIPHTDPHHIQTNAECMNFVRTLTTNDLHCEHLSHSHQAEQLTEVTSFLDLSLVYGNTVEQNAGLRAFQGGRMRTELRHGGEFPPQANNKSVACESVTEDETCFLAGDSRVNQNPGLTSIQVMLLRAHNGFADNLQAVNPHWDDERVFQEARKINIGAFQHVSYYEWLPLFLGEKNMKSNGLIYDVNPGSYVNDFDENIDPRVINEFATAAFRYFHTQIQGRLDLLSEPRARHTTVRLSDWFNRPSLVEAEYDNLSRGMVTQPEQDTDINLDVEIKHFLFRGNNFFGMDLKALDIQRNRDHGLASYNDFREFCGLKRAHSFEDFLDLIAPESVERLRTLYTSHEDVDLTVGGALESHVAGALAGPTFLCILTEQFFRTRVGDRFFYENGDHLTGFTREQLDSIRSGTSAAGLVCSTSNIQTIQPRAFERISLDNQLIPCDQIPRLDFNLWKEDVSASITPHFTSPDEHLTSFLYKKK